MRGDGRLEAEILAQVLRVSPVGILVYDASATCILANEAAARIAGGSVDGLVGQNFRRLESWNRDGLLAAAEESLSQRRQVARTLHSVSSFGQEVDAEFRFCIFDHSGSTYLLVLIHDLAREVEMESTFFAVTHDLRSPLRVIDGFASQLEEGGKNRLDAEEESLLAGIRENAVRMGGLIESLRTYARLGSSDLEFLSVDMEELVRGVYEEAVPQETRRHIEFSVSVLPPAFGDPRLLRQIWASLIANAAKFSSERRPAHLAVSGERSGDELIYRIRDDGLGFDMRYADRLFGVFQRLHTARQFAGAGMGLAIVQRAVRRLGGRVWAEGEVDRGATFSFALPAPREPPRPEDPAAAAGL